MILASGSRSDVSAFHGAVRSVPWTFVLSCGAADTAVVPTKQAAAANIPKSLLFIDRLCPEKDTDTQDAKM